MSGQAPWFFGGQAAEFPDRCTALVLERAPAGRHVLRAWKGRVQHLVQLAHFVADLAVGEDIGRIIAAALDHLCAQLQRIHPGCCHLSRGRTPSLVACARLDDARPCATGKQARDTYLVRRERHAQRFSEAADGELGGLVGAQAAIPPRPPARCARLRM
jgi:hypothetical protein